VTQCIPLFNALTGNQVTVTHDLTYCFISTE